MRQAMRGAPGIEVWARRGGGSCSPSGFTGDDKASMDNRVETIERECTDAPLQIAVIPDRIQSTDKLKYPWNGKTSRGYSAT